MLLGIERHKLPLKLNAEKVVAQKYKMYSLPIIIIITIEDGIAELTFKLHLGHRSKAERNLLFFLYLTGEIHYVLSYPASSPPKNIWNS